MCDTQTGREIACFQAATEDIDADIFRSVAFSPNGKYIVTGGGNTKREPEFHPSPYNGYHARLWDVATHKEIPEFTHHLGHTGWIMAMAFSPDGKILVTGGGSGELRWWNPETRQEIGRPPRQVQGSTVPSQFVHQDTILSVAFSPDGRLLATGSRDHTARIWDVKSRKPLYLLPGHNASVEALTFSPDGKTLATGSRDGVIKLWSLSTLRDHQVLDTLTLNSDQEGLHSLAFSPDGNTLASGHGSGNVLFWQAEPRKPFTPVGRKVVTLPKQQARRQIRLQANRQTTSLAQSTDNDSACFLQPNNNARSHLERKAGVARVCVVVKGSDCCGNAGYRTVAALSIVAFCASVVCPCAAALSSWNR